MAEFCQFTLQGPSDYLSDYWNILDWGSFLFFFYYLFLRFYLVNKIAIVGGGFEEHEAELVEVHAMLALNGWMLWFRTMRIFLVSPFVGSKVNMVMEMIVPTCEFLIMFVIVLLGFATSFNGLFPDHPDWGNFNSAFLKLWEASLGGFDYGLVMFDEKRAASGCALYTVFILLSTVMLLNLLIAIMGSVYETVQDNEPEEMAELFCKTVEKYSLDPTTISGLPAPLNLFLVFTMPFTSSGAMKVEFVSRTLFDITFGWLLQPGLNCCIGTMLGFLYVWKIVSAPFLLCLPATAPVKSEDEEEEEATAVEGGDAPTRSLSTVVLAAPQSLKARTNVLYQRGYPVSGTDRYQLCIYDNVACLRTILEEIQEAQRALPAGEVDYPDMIGAKAFKAALNTLSHRVEISGWYLDGDSDDEDEGGERVYGDSSSTVTTTIAAPGTPQLEDTGSKGGKELVPVGGSGSGDINTSGLDGVCFYSRTQANYAIIAPDTICQYGAEGAYASWVWMNTVKPNSDNHNILDGKRLQMTGPDSFTLSEPGDYIVLEEQVKVYCEPSLDSDLVGFQRQNSVVTAWEIVEARDKHRTPMIKFNKDGQTGWMPQSRFLADDTEEGTRQLILGTVNAPCEYGAFTIERHPVTGAPAGLTGPDMFSVLPQFLPFSVGEGGGPLQGALDNVAQVEGGLPFVENNLVLRGNTLKRPVQCGPAITSGVHIYQFCFKRKRGAKAGMKMGVLEDESLFEPNNNEPSSDHTLDAQAAVENKQRWWGWSTSEATQVKAQRACMTGDTGGSGVSWNIKADPVEGEEEEDEELDKPVRMGASSVITMVVDMDVGEVTYWYQFEKIGVGIIGLKGKTVYPAVGTGDGVSTSQGYVMSVMPPRLQLSQESIEELSEQIFDKLNSEKRNGITPKGFVHSFKPKRRFVTMEAVETVLDEQYCDERTGEGGFEDDQEGDSDDDGDDDPDIPLSQLLETNLAELQKTVDTNFKQALAAVDDKMEGKIIGIDMKIDALSKKLDAVIAALGKSNKD